MTKKLLTLLLIFSVSAISVFSQDYASPKKGSVIGFSANLSDFNQPLSLSNFNFNKLSPGFSLMYWKGLGNHFDLSVRYNGVFTDYTKNPNNSSNSGYGNEFEASLHARLLTDNHLFSPFLTAGIGVGGYGVTWAPYAPLGGGFQFNFSSVTYVFLQMNYRASLNTNKLDNSLFYSLGIAETISAPKRVEAPKVVAIPAVVPPKDSDGDGIVDSLDACPNIAGLAQFHGCPDTDGDGIPDKDDKCPNVKGLARYNGCPIPDTDGDGINDEEDKCPKVAGVAKYNGCPIPDTDGDGINDEEDRCPTVPGVKENQGCPLVKEDVVKKVAYAAKNIFFATGSSKLLAKSFKSLNEVSKIMKEDTNLKLAIEGNTDNTGKAELNQKLSDSRAKAVLEYLKTKGGIDESRLSEVGYGDTKPIASNKTAAGRAQNRRVDLKIQY